MATPGERGYGFQSQQSPEGVLETVKDKAQELASTAAARAQDAWESTKQGTQQAASAVATRAEDAWDRMTNCMSRYPLATLLTGLGLGFALAALVRELARPTSSMLERSRYNPPNVGP